MPAPASTTAAPVRDASVDLVIWTDNDRAAAIQKYADQFGQEQGIKVVLVESWNDVKLANRVAAEAGARAYVMASAVGAVKGADNYLAAIDYNVTTLAQALRQP